MFKSIVNCQYSPDIRNQLHRAVIDNEWTLRHLGLHRKLLVHKGCVNTIQWSDTGHLILSGADDKKIVLTNYADGKILTRVSTQHKANLFSARFFPGSGDRRTVSCSGDGVIIVTDLERSDLASQDVYTCHQGTVYDVVTVDNEPHTFLSIGEDGTARWFDVRLKSRCSQTSNSRQDVLFTYQCPLTSMAVNATAPYQLAVGTADSVVYVMDRRRLDAGNSSASTAQSVVSCLSTGDTRRPHQITSVQFSPDGQQILASYSGDSVYLFDVKDSSVRTPMSHPNLELEENFNSDADCASSHRRKVRHWQNFKRIRLRGDWSDTGPQAGIDQATPTENEIGQARPTVHASLMQRLSDVLTSMMQRRSQRITSVTSPVGSPVPEPAFPAPASVRPQHQPTQPAPPHRHHRSSLSEPAAMSTTPPVAATEDIDFVSYESLGRSSLDFGMAAEPAEAPLSSTIPTASMPMSIPAPASGDSGGQRLETIFSSFRIRQSESEATDSSTGGFNDAGCDDQLMEEDDDDDDGDAFSSSSSAARQQPRADDCFYRPQPRVKYVGNRNARTIINEATFWGNDHVMSGSDCGHVFIWNRWSAKVVRVLQADSHVVNRVRPHPFEPVLATAGIDYDIKLWLPQADVECAINVDELMARNARMLEETRDTVTVPATFMIRMLATLTQSRRPGNRTSDEATSMS